MCGSRPPCQVCRAAAAALRTSARTAAAAGPRVVRGRLPWLLLRTYECAGARGTGGGFPGRHLDQPNMCLPCAGIGTKITAVLDPDGYKVGATLHETRIGWARCMKAVLDGSV